MLCQPRVYDVRSHERRERPVHCQIPRRVVSVYRSPLQERLGILRHWDRLIDFEADASQSLAANAWLIASETREQTTGTCISSLVFDKGFEGDALGELPPYVFLSFRRSSTSALQTPLCNLGLEKGCHVIVSADRTLAINAPPGAPLPRMHIVRGFLHSATDTKVAVKASRDDWTRIQNLVNDGPDDRPMLFRLDRLCPRSHTDLPTSNFANAEKRRESFDACIMVCLQFF